MSHFHHIIFLCIYFSTFSLISCQQRTRYRDDRRFEDDRTGVRRPGDVQEPPIVDGSYFDINKDRNGNTQQQVTNEPSKFDWTGSRRVSTTLTTNGRDSSGSQPSTFRRTVYRRQNTTTTRTSTPRNNTYDGQTRQTSYRRRYESLYNNSDDTQSPSRSSISSSIDALLNNQSSTEYRGGSYTYNTRRYNTSSAHGTSQTSTINGQSVQSPILWYNRTWHWSTNRSRQYDPDLDGTTLPPRLETGAEEEWDGTDIIRPPFDDRHPFGRQLSPRSQDSFLYYSNIRIDII